MLKKSLSFRRIILLLLFFVFTPKGFSAKFPETFTEKTKLSIIQINYKEPSRKVFSKYCLRIFDIENNFDRIIDFSLFKNFEDPLFAFKFYFKSEKAFIESFSFFDYILNEKEKNRSFIFEHKLNLTQEEIFYICRFITNINNHISYYSYDFDIKNKNSRHFLTAILEDTIKTNGSFINNRSLIYNTKQISEPHPQKNKIYFPEINKNFFALVLLSLVSFSILIITVYQCIFFFRKTHFRSLVYKTSEVIDFFIFFPSGLLGLFFLYQFLFSEQSLYKHNYYFLIFNPLNLFVSFLIFFPNCNLKKNNILCWGLLIFLPLLSTGIKFFISKHLPLHLLLAETSICLRYIWYLIKAISIRSNIQKHEI